VQDAKFIVADGFPIAVAATFFGVRKTGRIDFPREIISIAASLDFSLFLLCGRRDVVEVVV
jgi:UDP-N-acetyl-D-mannosaminuronic acid transferase (WecB/TagA/CpsF family)